MTPETVKAIHRYHDFALAAIAVQFECSMDEVRDLVTLDRRAAELVAMADEEIQSSAGVERAGEGASGPRSDEGPQADLTTGHMPTGPLTPADVRQVGTNPVANVGEGASSAIAAASDDPASREDDDADRQRLAPSGFTGEAAVASPKTIRDVADEPGREAPAATYSPAPVDAAVTAGTDLRELAAAAPGQIIREGDAPRETDCLGGDASRPDTELPQERVDDLGSVQDARKMSMDGQVNVDLDDGVAAGETTARFAGTKSGSAEAAAEQSTSASAPFSAVQEAMQALTPKPRLRDRVLALHQEHPDWPKSRIATELGVGSGSVTNAVMELGLVFPVAENTSRKPDSAASRVEAYHREHPDAPAGEIALALGLEPSAVRAAAVARKLTFRKLSHEERSAIQQAVFKRSAHVRHAEEPDAVETSEPAPKPTPPLKQPEPLPYDASDDAEEPFAPKARPGRPKGRQFRLRSSTGMFLHMSGSGLVPGKTYAWIGTEAQLLAARKAFPDARDLTEVPVAKDVK